MITAPRDSLPARMGGTVETEMAPDATIREGDVVYVLGWKRVARIEPYTGRLKGCIGLVTTVPGAGFSLWDGMETERAK